jgi:hypothetical protein
MSSKDKSQSRHVRHTRAAKPTPLGKAKPEPACTTVDDFLARMSPHLDLDGAPEPDSFDDILRGSVCPRRK